MDEGRPGEPAETQDLAQGRDIVFIGGCMRTGTTLLQRILCAGAETNPMITEAQYLDALLALHVAWRRRYDFFLKDYFDSREDFAAFSRGLVDALLRQTRSRYRAARFLVLKTPMFTRRFPLLADWYPAARFIVMIRDPRDTVASIIKVGARHRASGLTNQITELGRDIGRIARLHNAFYEPLARAWPQGTPRVMMLRYEELVTDPEPTLRRVSAFTGQTFDPGQLVPDKAWVGAAEETARNHFVRGFMTPLLAEAPQASRIGRHRKRLSAREIEEVEKGCADFNRRFRYW